MAESIDIRDATEADLHFCVWSWLRSFRNDFNAGLVRFSRWQETMLPELTWMLRDSDVLVAYNPEHSSDSKADIYGWLAVRRTRKEIVRSRRGAVAIVTVTRPLVLYCYVKSLYRGQGVARDLFRAAEIDPWATHYDYLCRTRAIIMSPEVAGRPPRKDGRTGRILDRMRCARWTPLALREDTDEREAERQEDLRPSPSTGTGRMAERARGGPDPGWLSDPSHEYPD